MNRLPLILSIMALLLAMIAVARGEHRTGGRLKLLAVAMLIVGSILILVSVLLELVD